ncbi:S-layer homology domain-containing protein [Thermus arciformis]|uniref:S-layer homology domain-containing protein n=1 Tax=Thermus arciformis TaxID=482827 RepID=A0A1G7DED8_9DEIN|nr:S-layer homology domain-containing protein [Thermus arciformis]SDE49873.1 S-layer homology domain-containing protein [Thermus arciformis]
MKKRLVTLLAGLLTVLSMGFGLAQFSDVPAGHWAKEAVEALAAKGIIVGFPDGTYRGNENLTRYQAALIIYRLLQQIEEELKAKGTSPTMEAMSSEDLEALKNAVQELAAELAALGVRVSALEDSAATKDDIARLEAMIAELKAQPAPEPGMDQAALQDLMDRVEAASIAADTALAQAQQLAEQLDALAQDVEGVKGDVAALSTQVEANAQAIQALNELAVLLNQDVLALQDRVTALEKGLADLQGVDFEQFASKEDVAAVQDFAAALRSDLVGLSDKVSNLERTVATLQRNAFTISGSLSLGYSVYRAWGPDASAAGPGTANTFDIDRLFSSKFSTEDGDGDGSVGDEADLGKNTEGVTNATLSVNFSTGKLDAASDPGKLNSYPGLVQFSLRATLTNPGKYDPSTGAPTYPINLTLDEFSSTLAVAKDQTLSFSFGRSVRSKFTEYVFDNDYNSRGHGFVATFKPGLLGATLTGVYGSKGANNGDFTYFRGARLALSPAEGFTLGGSFVQEGLDANQGTITPTFPTPTTVYGVDASVKLGPVGLAGEYFNSDAAPNANGYYVKADVALGSISVAGNYRNIGAGVTGANMLSGDATSTLDQGGWGGVDSSGNVINGAPFRSNRQGFGVSASAGLGPITVKGYYDSSTILANETISNSYGAFSYSANDQLVAYGGQADLAFSGFALSGFYRIAQLNGATTRYILTEKPVDAVYASEYGAKLAHDGASKDALVPKLNLTAAYTQKYDNATSGFTTQDIAVYGSYELALGPLTLKPMGRYHTQDAAAASTSSDYTTVKYGVAASIALDLPFKPSLSGEYYARSTQVTSANSGSSATGTISESKYAVGLKLGEFLFKNSSVEAKYASYTGSGLNAPILLGVADAASSTTSDYLYNNAVSSVGSNQGSVTGWYFTWTYWDLTFAYVEADVNNNGNQTHGQAFKISYTVKF